MFKMIPAENVKWNRVLHNVCAYIIKAHAKISIGILKFMILLWLDVSDFYDMQVLQLVPLFISFNPFAFSEVKC